MTKIVKYLGGSITKVIDEERKVVGGYFTDDAVDYAGHIIDKDATTSAVEDYRSFGNIRLMHEDPIGVVDNIGEPWNYLEVKVSNSAKGQEVWQDIKDGIYKGFSVGIIVNDGDIVNASDLPEDKFLGLSASSRKSIEKQGKVFVIKDYTMIEISIVDRPANPRALISAAKGDFAEGAEVLPSIKELTLLSKVVGELKKNHSPLVGSVETKELEETSMEQENKELETAEEVIEEAVTEEAVEEIVVDETEKAVEESTETEDVVEKDVEATEEPEDVSEEEVQEVLKYFSDLNQAISDVNASLAELKSLVAESNEKSAGVMQSIAETLAKMVTTEVETEEVSTESTEEPTEEKGAESEPVNISEDEQIEKIAKAVTKYLRAEREDRKGIVNQGEDEGEEPLSLSKLNTNDLRKLLGRSAALIGNR